MSLSLSRIQSNKAAGPNTKWYKTCKVTWVWSAYVHVLRCSVMSDSLWLQRSLPGLLCPLEFFQARILEWVALSSSGGSSQPRDWTPVSYISCLSSRFFTTSATGEVQPVDAGKSKVLEQGVARGFHLWSQHPDLRRVPHENDEDNNIIIIVIVI